MFDHGDSAAEAPQSLRHFEADIAAAEHDQMRGKPIELERLDMRQRSGLGQPGNVGNGRVRTQIEKDLLALKAPCPSLREPNFDCLGSDEAAFAKNEVQTIDRKPCLVDRDQSID